MKNPIPTQLMKAAVKCLAVLLCGLFGGNNLLAGVAISEQSGAPSPGTYDVSQLSTTGDSGSPSGKNYYSNNNPAPGEKFTTGSFSGGYNLTDIFVQTGNGSGNSIGGSTTWTLYLYSVSGSSATLLTAYSGLTTGVAFNNGDWLHFSGLTLPLAANTTYAYAIYSGTSAYTGLENSSTALSGANAELVPNGGGSMTSVSGFNGVFDVVLAEGTTATVTQQTGAPTPGTNDVSQLSTVGDTSNPNSKNYFSNAGTPPTPPGEQFTTPSGNPGGYTLTGVSVNTGNGSGNSIGRLTPWTIYIYSVSGSTATLLQTYSGLTGVTFTNNSWINFSGLSVALAANATYAYAVYSGSGPYTGLENSTASLAGGSAVLVNSGSGAITTVSGFNGVFDAALTPIAAPGPPVLVSATPGNNEVTLSWTAPGGTVTGYNVYRSTSFGSGYAILPAGTNVSGSPFTDNTAVNGTAYYYVITALNGSLQSTFSGQVSATPPRANTLVTWNGIQTADDNWTLSFSEGNWTGNGSGNYFLAGDSVFFNDDSSSGAQTVSLNATVDPASLTFVNTNVSYTISGSGAISGATAITNAGPGTVTLAESGGDNFSGGITASGGTLVLDNANGAITGGELINPGAVTQVGNADGLGVLPAGRIIANGTLVFNHGADSTVQNVISGSGTLIEEGGDLLQLAGNSLFTGTVIVTNNSTLQAGSDTAFGTTNGVAIVASGSTLDENGFYNDAVGSEPIIVQGAGVGGNGALVNNGGGYGDLLNVTLAGDTTIGGTVRLDFTGKLSTSGNPYNLTIVGSSYHEWNDFTPDASLANVTLGGSAQLGYKGTTTIGNPADALTVLSGATLVFWQNGPPVLSKHLVLNDGATLQDGDASATVNGPVTLTNTSSTLYCNFNIGGPSVTLNGPLDGNAEIYMTTGTGSLIANSNSPTFTGGAQVYAGKLVINGNFGSGNVVMKAGTTLAGIGTVGGLADVSGALLAGGAGVAGTFNAAGGLVLENSAVLTNDLSATIAGSNDLIKVTGDLTVNNNTMVLNPLSGTLQNGIYPLITYTGNLNGAFAGVQTVSPSVYTLTLTNDTSTSPKEIGVIVSGSPSLLTWNDGSSDGEWNVLGSVNWTNLAAHSTEQFASADAVVFDDSITLAANWGSSSSTNIDIAAGQMVIPSVITNNSTVDYTISGAGSISGTAGIVKRGSGTLTLSNLNDFTGGVAISAGAVWIYGAGGDTGLGSGTPVVNAGGTLVGMASDAFGYAPNTAPTNILINGGTVSDLGAASYRITLPNLTFIGGTLTSAAGNAGDGDGNYSTWGDGTTCTITSLATNSTAVINASAVALGRPTTFNIAAGSVTGGATPGVDLLVAAQLVPYGTQPINKIGSGTMALDASNTFVVPITISAGVLQLGTINDVAALMSPLGGWGTVTNNATISFASSESVTVTNDLTGTGAVVVTSGTAILDGVNSYTGSTTVNGGTLAGSGTLGGNVVVNSGGTISAGENGGLGVLTAAGNASLEGNTFLKLDGATNDVLSVGGTLNYGGVLTLTNISATPLTSGQSFRLFNAGSYGSAFGSIVTEPPLTAGLIWNTNNLALNGTISVATQPQTTPVFTHIGLHGATLTITATNGASNGQYVLLESTNVKAPFTLWIPVLTNAFDANGNLNLSTNIINPGIPQQFFILAQ